MDEQQVDIGDHQLIEVVFNRCCDTGESHIARDLTRHEELATYSGQYIIYVIRIQLILGSIFGAVARRRF